MGPPPAPEPYKPPPGATETTWAVICGDNEKAWPRDPARYRKDAIRGKVRYPIYGDFTSTIKPCAFWGRPAEPVTVVNRTSPAPTATRGGACCRTVRPHLWVRRALAEAWSSAVPGTVPKVVSGPLLRPDQCRRGT
ncbi:hypothetical protein GCM10010232_15960 [Streptomyces amakusaensis]|uniref:Uncharacterized protein n=1 Tax=Streptomyces amakusaensis TaxID=67271 RepID=A0ABW0AJG4_9ACTN